MRRTTASAAVALALLAGGAAFAAGDPAKPTGSWSARADARVLMVGDAVQRTVAAFASSEWNRIANGGRVDFAGGSDPEFIGPMLPPDAAPPVIDYDALLRAGVPQ